MLQSEPDRERQCQRERERETERGVLEAVRVFTFEFMQPLYCRAVA